MSCLCHLCSSKILSIYKQYSLSAYNDDKNYLQGSTAVFHLSTFRTHIGGREQGTGWQMGGASLSEPSSRHVRLEGPSSVKPSSQEKLMTSPTLSSRDTRDTDPCSKSSPASHVTSVHVGLCPDQVPLPRHVWTACPRSV